MRSAETWCVLEALREKGRLEVELRRLVSGGGMQCAKAVFLTGGAGAEHAVISLFCAEHGQGVVGVHLILVEVLILSV
jgi:hypothetical protein